MTISEDTLDIEYIDNDGYPTEEALDRIKKWPFPSLPLLEHARALMVFVESLWAYKDCFDHDPYNRVYTLRTAGWSGNESLISALQENVLFWTMCWASSHRGGKYVFQIPAPKEST